MIIADFFADLIAVLGLGGGLRESSVHGPGEATSAAGRGLLRSTATSAKDWSLGTYVETKMAGETV